MKHLSQAVVIAVSLSTIAVFGTTEAGAARYRGLSAFAAMSQKFPCDRFLETMRGVDNPAMSVLWGTFGNSGQCMARFMEENRDRPHLLQIHLSNQVCVRKQNCGSGELFRQVKVKRYNKMLEGNDAAMIHAVSTRVHQIRAWVNGNKNHNTRVMLTTGLEDNYSTRGYRNLVKMIENSGWPYDLARNPVLESTQTSSPPYQHRSAKFIELHGIHPPFPRTRRCVANLDGVSVQTGDKAGYSDVISPRQAKRFLRDHDGCVAALLWYAPLQGYEKGGDFIPPRKRDFRLSRNASKVLRSVLRRN